MSGTFGGIYLERTLERLDSRQSTALAELVRADANGTLGTTAQELRGRGFTGDQVAVMTDSARELARMDGLLRQYVGPHLADRLEPIPSWPGWEDRNERSRSCSRTCRDSRRSPRAGRPPR